MKKHLLKFLLSSNFLLLTGLALAQAPDGYYNSIEGKQNSNLKTAVFEVIQNPKVSSYDGLWTSFKTTDKKENGKVWDMYSDVPGGTPPYEFTFGSNQCGSYSGEASCYNREHSFPKSWFSNAKPMYSDLYHLYPTDGYVNGRRGNDPFGEVGTAKWTSKNGSKSGTSNFGGYTGNVFEPINEYKGDFARTYFYMATCYEDKVSNWTSAMLSKNKYPAYAKWAVDLLLKWHRQDPVSTKEINRNNEVYKIQKNRNAFIDYPELAEYIWGAKINDIYYLGNDPDPIDPVDPIDTNVELLANITFKSTLAPFTESSLVGTQKWTSNTTYGAMISGFDNASVANEDWLISPSHDFTELISAELNFKHAINKGNLANLKTNHTLWASTDYVEGSSYAAATWTQIAIPTYPTGNNWTFVSSGAIAFPEALMGQANVHFAFKYLSSNVESSTWEITELSLNGKKSTSGIDIDEVSPEIFFYASGNNIGIYIENYEGDIIVYDMLGRLVNRSKADRGTNLIPVRSGQLYIVKVGTVVAKVYVN